MTPFQFDALLKALRPNVPVKFAEIPADAETIGVNVPAGGKILAVVGELTAGAAGFINIGNVTFTHVAGDTLHRQIRLDAPPGTYFDRATPFERADASGVYALYV